MKKEIWVLVANASEAAIYHVDSIKKMTEIARLYHPESRLTPHELVSDSPGRAYESQGTARHAMEPQTNPQKQEFMLFAKSIADRLDLARSQNKFSKLYIAASPNFLGLLRNSLGDKTQGLIAQEIDKDLTKSKPEDFSNYFSFSFL